VPDDRGTTGTIGTTGTDRQGRHERRAMTATDPEVIERNGLDLTELRQTAEEVHAASGPVPLVVATRHRWARGPATDGRGDRIEALGSTIDRTHHHVRTDLPDLLGGRDTAPAPTETLLTALAGCITATFVDAATLEGIDLGAVDVSTRTSVDLRGVFGVDGVPATLNGVEVELAVRADAPPEVLAAIGAASAVASPTAASLTNPVPVHLTVRRLD
jgi:uncharacterized OsmC-like protein